MNDTVIKVENFSKLYRLLDMEMEDTKYTTSEEQKKAIEEARQEYKNKRFKTATDVDNQFDKWLGE